MTEPAQGSVGSVAEDKAGAARPGSDRLGLPPGGLSIVDSPHTRTKDVQPSQQDYNAMVLRFR